MLIPLTSARKLPRGEIFRPPNASMPRLVTLVTRIEVATEHSWLKPGRKGTISEETWVDKIGTPGTPIIDVEYYIYIIIKIENKTNWYGSKLVPQELMF